MPKKRIGSRSGTRCSHCGREGGHSKSGRRNCTARYRFKTEWDRIVREALCWGTRSPLDPLDDGARGLVEGVQPKLFRADDDTQSEQAAAGEQVAADGPDAKREDALIALCELLEETGSSGEVEIVRDFTAATAQGIVEAVGWYGSADDAIERGTGFSTIYRKPRSTPSTVITDEDGHERELLPTLLSVMTAGSKIIINAQAVGELLAAVSANRAGLSALAFVAERTAKDAASRHARVLASSRSDPLNATAAALDVCLLSPVSVSVVEVDGRCGTRATPATGLQLYRRVPSSAQRPFAFAAPRRLAGRPATDVVIAAIGPLRLTGDERSPIRGDVYDVANFAYALSGPTLFAPEDGAEFFGGGNTALQRWFNACRIFDSLAVQWSNAELGAAPWVTLGRAEQRPDGTVILAAPDWFRERNQPSAWRLSGSLWRRRRLLDAARTAGGTAGFWSGIRRTLAGFEARLAWSPSAGKGRSGRIADYLRPANGRTVGPGMELTLPWDEVLMAAGDYVAQDARPQSTEGKRYRRRIDALVEAGYSVPADSGEAPGGDVIEIVRVTRGQSSTITRKGQPPSITIRASKAYVEAVARSQDPRRWTLLPAGQVFR